MRQIRVHYENVDHCWVSAIARNRLEFRMLAERELSAPEQRAQQLNCTRHLSLSPQGVLEVKLAFDREAIKELSCSYVVSDGVHTSDAAIIKVPYTVPHPSPLSYEYTLRVHPYTLSYMLGENYILSTSYSYSYAMIELNL